MTLKQWKQLVMMVDIFNDELVTQAILSLDFYKPPTPERCRQCGTEATEHFFTSERDRTVFCGTCFDARKEQQLAKEQPDTKSTHPLDAWMEEPTA